MSKQYTDGNGDAPTFTAPVAPAGVSSPVIDDCTGAAGCQPGEPQAPMFIPNPVTP